MTDDFGNAVEGVTVLFSVTGANPTRGSARTNAGGDAQFCYTGTMLGSDVITATADANTNGSADAGEPTGGATKTWVTPASSCGEVEAEGYILTALGKGLFKLSVDSDAGAQSPSGYVAYADTGAKKVLVSMHIDSAVIVDSSHAEILGTGKVNGGAAQPFRVSVDHTAAGDTFSIEWAGYAAAGNVVKGNLKIDAEPCTPEHENDDDDDDGGNGGDDHGNGGGGDHNGDNNNNNNKDKKDKGHGGEGD